MAKSANSKVVFVPMQLQGDVGAQLQNQASGSGLTAAIQSESGTDTGMGESSRYGVINSLSNI
jgi:erythrocyte band 7 integral membrane protein